MGRLQHFLIMLKSSIEVSCNVRFQAETINQSVLLYLAALSISTISLSKSITMSLRNSECDELYIRILSSS